jgi:hypothetical protein
MDKTYLKGTLIKYLEYAAKGEEKEALTLEKVLFTILGATSQDLDKLQKERALKTNSGLLSYFYQAPGGTVAKAIELRNTPQKRNERIDNLFN